MRTMYDTIDVMSLPDGADLYAGYDDGAWPDADAIAAKFPGKPVVRITTNPADDFGDCLDVENGDASPTDAPAWVAKRRAAGADPSVYCSLDPWPTIRQAFAAANVPEPHYWVAAYPGPGPVLIPGAVAHQYASPSTGSPGNYDVSVVADYWPGVDPSGPVWQVKPPYDVTVDGPIADVRTYGTDGAYVLTSSGAIYAFRLPYFGGANGQDYFVGRQAATLMVHLDNNSNITGYTITATSGEKYSYPVGAPNP